MKQLALKTYVFGLLLWCRIGKRPFSWLLNLPKPKLPPTLRSFATFEEFSEWWSSHTRWKSDQLGGVIDTFPHLGNAEWQFVEKDLFEDDCDGLAYLAANYVKPFADTTDEIFVVTIVTDPFSWPGQALQMAAHVICVFRRAGQWRVISNSDVLPGAWATFDDALQLNSYANGHPLLFCEVRRPDLRFVRSERLI